MNDCTVQIRPGIIPGTVIATGYLLQYGSYNTSSADNREGWIESVDQDAVMHAVAVRPYVRLRINEGGIPVARTTDGTLELSSDAVGLRMTATLVEGAVGVPQLRGGEELSVNWNVTADVWSEGRSRRLITGMSLDNCDINIHTDAHLATI